MSQKYQTALNILDTSWLSVHLRTDVPEPYLVIPKHLRRLKNLNLRIDRETLPDLHLDPMGFTGTATFGGVAFEITVPWSAVFAMTNEQGQGTIWPDDQPKVGERGGLKLIKGGVTRTTPAIGVLRLVEPLESRNSVA